MHPAPSGTAARQHRTIPSRGPWLRSGLSCPAASSLTMASSEPLVLFHPLMDSRMAPPTHGPALGGEREVPQFTPCFCPFVPSSVPRWTGWLPLAVLPHPHWPSPTLVLARHPQVHAGSVLAWVSVTRLQGSLNATARRIARPSPTRTITFELSPDWDRSTPMSSMTTRANSQLPQPDSHRQETRHYGLRTKNTIRERPV